MCTSSYPNPYGESSMFPAEWVNAVKYVDGKGPPPGPGSQAAKLPDQQALQRALRSLASGSMRGSNTTQLSGPRGIDPSLLNIGRNTLLGA